MNTFPTCLSDLGFGQVRPPMTRREHEHNDEDAFHSCHREKDGGGEMPPLSQMLEVKV